MIDGVLYLVDNGCKWRALPHDYPPYSTVHTFYRRARLNVLWEKVLRVMVERTRVAAGREPGPSINPAKQAVEAYPTLKRFCADAGYRGTFVLDLDEILRLGVDISEKIKPHEWEKLPWRWVVERTLSRLGHSPRLSITAPH